MRETKSTEKQAAEKQAAEKQAAEKAAPQVAAAAKAPPIKVVACPESCMTLAEHAEPRVIIDIPAGTPYEHLFEPRFWASIAPKIADGRAAGVILICRDFENSYRAELIVRNAGRGWMKVEELHKHEFKVSTAGPEQASDYVCEFINPANGWALRRKSDRQIIAKGLKDEAAAQIALQQHLRLMAA
jgi:hypothetical protein